MKRVVVLLAVVAAMVALGVLSAAASGSGSVVASTSQTFYPGPEQTFVVPAVGRIDVTVVGGTGGPSTPNGGGGYDEYGGYGSVVTARINVGAGTLYIDVGSNGDPLGNGGTSGTQPSGGNGGTLFGSACCAGGGGGGASLILTCSLNSSACRSLFYTGSDPRLAVAGGGGGAGGDDGCAGGNAGGGIPSPSDYGRKCSNGGGGGNGTGGNGRDVTGYFTGHPSTIEAYGGRGATQSAPGPGGSTTDGTPGSPGSGPYGGNGYTITQSNSQGAGGGGGYYGGGGGADCHASCEFFGAGGGAGSSWVVPAGFQVTYGNDTTANPYVQITYTPKLRKV